jgi:hypothetical protein
MVAIRHSKTYDITLIMRTISATMLPIRPTGERPALHVPGPTTG